MTYLPERKSAIFARYKAGMSLRRIIEIYGCTTHDVEDVVDCMQRANAANRFIGFCRKVLVRGFNSPVQQHGEGQGIADLAF